jgi:hypothetical protein
MRHVLVWGSAGIGTLVALIAIIVLIGAMLPVAHHVTKSAVFSAPQQKLWDLAIANFHRTNDGSYAIVDQDPPQRLVTAIVKKGLPFGGRWTFHFEPAAGGTKLTITEDGEIYNPFFRFVSRFILGYEGSIDAFFAALHEAAGTGAASDH